MPKKPVARDQWQEDRGHHGEALRDDGRLLVQDVADHRVEARGGGLVRPEGGCGLIQAAAMLLLEQIRELVVGDEHVAVRGLRLAEAEQLGAQSAQLPSSCCGGEPQRLVAELLAVVVDPLQGVLGLLGDRGHQSGAAVLRRGLHGGAHDGEVLQIGRAHV